ncbi:MAG: hypothetical protein PHW72_00965 [Candidatus Pacebacteria bacterium]|nr:hypothetical protein [Candidatus Paceibacterota bacterium]
MEHNFVQQQKNQRNLIIVFISVIIVTGFIFWFGFLRKDSGSSSQEGPATITEPETMGQSVFSENEIYLDFATLNDPIFQTLISFSPILPPSTSTGLEIGRENPFIPFKSK